MRWTGHAARLRGKRIVDIAFKAEFLHERGHLMRDLSADIKMEVNCMR
jgi:hypothetical protein